MKKEISEVIRMEVKDPRVGFVTVTNVEVANDLQHAKVFVSVFGDADSKQATMAALTKAVGYIRGEVGRRLRMRLTPEIVFRLDESGDYSDHINRVLRDLKAGDASAREK
jgi:ribosome-binding factor A